MAENTKISGQTTFNLGWDAADQPGVRPLLCGGLGEALRLVEWGAKADRHEAPQRNWRKPLT